MDLFRKYAITIRPSLIAFVLSTCTFTAALYFVFAQQESVSFDALAVSYFAAHRARWVTSAMLIISFIGDEPFLAGVALVGCLWWHSEGHRPLLLLVGGYLGVWVLESSLKATLGRPRPPVEYMAAIASGGAFPSGHAAMAATVYATIAYLAAKQSCARTFRLCIWSSAAMFVLAIGFSRVYLGVHWPTDVLGGWSLGVLWLSILLMASRFHRSENSLNANR
jgi:undecaprenyl-diphosphatase